MSSQDVPALQAEVARLQTEIHALRDGGEEITIPNYLLTRLEQLGVKVRLRWHSGGLWFLTVNSICLECLEILI
jgi:hypothetical protein